MYVKNAIGADGLPLSVQDPDRRDRLPADGKYRPVAGDYWVRRVQAGDVIAHPGTPKVSEMEGYEPPVEPEDLPTADTAERSTPRRAGKAGPDVV